MGILHDAFAKVKHVLDRWHDHVDPETSFREAQVAFMNETAKLVHELEDQIKAFTSPVTAPQLAKVEVPLAPLIEQPAAHVEDMAPAVTAGSEPASAPHLDSPPPEPAAPASEATDLPVIEPVKH